MKIYSLISILSLITYVFASSIVLSPDFRSPKRIMFSSFYGGSSHVAWVVEILDELSRRGHSTFFVTNDNQVKFTRNYPSIVTQSIGLSLSDRKRKEAMDLLSTHPMITAMKAIFEANTMGFPNDYAKVKELILSNKIDILICDSVNRPCIEAATNLKIPFVVTSSFPQGEDTSAPYINNQFVNMDNPTTEFMSLKDRLLSKFIKPLKYAILLKKSIVDQKNMLKALGIKPSLHVHEKYKDRVKLVNTAFGFERGRPIGPLVEFIGPILPKSYPGLTEDIKGFMKGKKHIAYVAFGQHAMGSEKDSAMVMTGLLEALENNAIDGIIWATSTKYNMFPSYIRTRSNTTYDIQGASRDKIMVLDWAPQMAILQHRSTELFVTHGGAGSLYESAYAGVRVVVYPFFGDQEGAAVTAEKNGIGLYLNRKDSQENANKVIGRVAKDKDGEFQENTNRFKALVQIKTERGVERGADIVEEVIFVQQKDGHVQYRWDVKRNMSFIKANNFDLYCFLVCFMICFSYGIWYFISTYFFTISRKIKTT